MHDRLARSLLIVKVLASDGIFDVLTNQHALELVAEADGVQDAAVTVVEEACKRWLLLEEEEGPAT